MGSWESIVTIKIQQQNNIALKVNKGVIQLPTQRRSKWDNRYKHVCYKFDEAVEKTREQTAEFWDGLAIPKRRLTQSDYKPDKPKKKNKSCQLSKLLMAMVKERDNNRCQFPGCYKNHGTNIHHIIFKSNGGKNEIENLVTLCLHHHTLSKESPHISNAWRRYWEGWAESRYPSYWFKIWEEKKITTPQQLNIGGR